VCRSQYRHWPIRCQSGAKNRTSLAAAVSSLLCSPGGITILGGGLRSLVASSCCCCCSKVIVERLESEMKDINSNSEALKRNFLDLTELRHILSKTHNFFEEVNITCRVSVLVACCFFTITITVYSVSYHSG